ncbi:kinase-like protein [Xylariaceae sp. FL0662B]|nr:kinase-like protein [Xylariaceae sp. FL0662B]
MEDVDANKQNTVSQDSKSTGSESYQQGDLQSWIYQNVPIIDDVENIEKYKPGGYAPIDLGGVLADRYEVIYKLGHGGIATTWLCWDLVTDKWRAVKINSAKYSHKDCQDRVAMEHLKGQGLDHAELEANHIVAPLDTFSMETSNGTHFCAVMDVYGPRLNEWRTEELGKDSERINDICYQVTEGLGFLHSKGLCHGDFRPDNILMKLKPGCFDHLSRDEMRELLGPPDIADVWTVDGDRSEHSPLRVVTAASWERFRAYVTDEIAIVDFGEAYRASDPPEDSGIPLMYASPEILFKDQPSGVGSDIWALALTLLEVRLDRYENYGPSTRIRRMERFVGPIPHTYRSEARRILLENGWEKPMDRAQDTGELSPLTGALDIPWDGIEEKENQLSDLTHPLEMTLGLEQRGWGREPIPEDPSGQAYKTVQLLYRLPRDEVFAFADLLRQMLKYNSEERISASIALEHRWFRKNHHKECDQILHLIKLLLIFLCLALLALTSWILLSLVQQIESQRLINKIYGVQGVEVCTFIAAHVNL